MRPTPALPTTLVVVNARIWTGDPRRPWADGLAIAVDRVVGVGSSAEMRKRASAETRVVDAHGMMIVPGFIDSHIHFLEGGFGLSSVQLRDARTRREFVDRIAAYAATIPPGTWITHGDWDHERWGGELPCREWIDAATPSHPVWVRRLDGHMSLANGAALAAAGVTKETSDVEGGTIVRDEHGEPTGIFKDNAESLVSRAVPAPSDEQEDRRAQGIRRRFARLAHGRDVGAFRRCAERLRTLREHA
jgi:predicted amidohydrolase YtcJ